MRTGRPFEGRRSAVDETPFAFVILSLLLAVFLVPPVYVAGESNGSNIWCIGNVPCFASKITKTQAFKAGATIPHLMEATRVPSSVALEAAHQGYEKVQRPCSMSTCDPRANMPDMCVTR